MGTKTQGTLLKVESARATGKPITAITQASPPVLTVVGHGYSAGDQLAIDSIAGMVQLNKRSGIVANVTTDTFALKGYDSTLYDAYLSGGFAYKLTMSPVGTVSAIPTLFSGSAAEITTTHLKSVAVEKDVGLPDPGDATFDVIVDKNDSGQSAVSKAFDNNSIVGWSVTLTDGTTACFLGFVKSRPYAIAANEVVRATIGVTLSAFQSEFA